ncbi:endonuclease V [Actinocatenispora rupis]|uniref:Endonuclease V n=1 Tax=Actinocatenispora rupis TaxID=519421 RepID=A0A8J3J6T3_9ACTN|nr:endonuclease V [Actinocatenispora rupis]
MDIPDPGTWPSTVAEAEAVQDRLRPLVVREGELPAPLRTVAGLDVSYGPDDRLAAAVVVLDADTLAPVDRATRVGRAAFGYVPGLFAFRELPALLGALADLRTTPDVLLCDGYGLAHPRRFGLACHLGVLTGLPTIGIAKTPFVGRYEEPGRRRGDWAPLTDGGEVVGRVLRTRDGVRPVYVSVGHRLGLDAACALALRLTPAYRLPETTRRADRLSRDVLAGV